MHEYARKSGTAQNDPPYCHPLVGHTVVKYYFGWIDIMEYCSINVTITSFAYGTHRSILRGELQYTIKRAVEKCEEPVAELQSFYNTNAPKHEEYLPGSCARSFD